MKHPSQEDLLGYVLGALDAQEARDLEEQIDANPLIEEQLLEIRSAMAPLDSLSFGEPGHRPGLARRTCELVANLKHNKQELFEDSNAIGEIFGASNSNSIREIFDDRPAAESELQPASVFSQITDRLVHPASISRIDVLAGIAIMAIFASILLPAISQSRFNGRINSCKHNLREVGTAMLVYTDLHSGRFVNVAGADVDSSTTSMLAPALKGRGFIPDDSLFSCAGLAQMEPPRIPTLQQVRSATGAQLEVLKRRMGGDFGYSLGFFDGKKYSAAKNDGSSHTVLIADMPSADMPGRSSRNHGGKGQNCFFADGRVQFITAHAIGDDAIYENDLGIVGPGVGERDNVIAPSHLPAIELRFQPVSAPVR